MKGPVKLRSYTRWTYCFIHTSAKRFLTACFKYFYSKLILSLLCLPPFPTLGSCGQDRAAQPEPSIPPSSTLLPSTLLPFLSFPRQEPSPPSPGAGPLSHPPQLDGASHFPRRIQATLQKPRQNILLVLYPKGPIPFRSVGPHRKLGFFYCYHYFSFYYYYWLTFLLALSSLQSTFMFHSHILSPPPPPFYKQAV